MAEPESKYRFDYQEPENVRSKVPAEQRLRESVEASELANAKETVSGVNKIENPGEHTLTPEIRNGVFHTIKSPEHPEIHSDVLHEPQPIRSETGDRNSDGNAKKRTRIPKLRFRQAANRVKKERRESTETENGTIPYQRRSSIPRLQTKLPTEERKHENEEPTSLDNEFDKIYDEVVTSPVEPDVSLLNAKVEDPVKVEHLFDEIIRAYDEDDIPSANDKTKHSRIPTFKRRSEHDVEVPKTLQNTASDNNASADRVKVKDVINESFSKKSKPKYRKPTRISVPKKKPFKITDSVSQEETIETSFKQAAKELEDNVNFVDTFKSPNEEVTPNNSLDIIDFTKIEDSDLIDNVSYSMIESFEDKLPINNETVELLPATVCVVEVKTAQEPITKTTVGEIHNVTETLFQESEYIVQNSVKQDTSVVPDITIVDELNIHKNLEIGLEPEINKDLPSDKNTPETKEDNKVVMSNELLKTKSLLSRTATFELTDPTVASKSRDNKTPKIKPTSTIDEAKSYEKLMDIKNNIVIEVSKTTQNEINPNTDSKFEHNIMSNEYINNVNTREIKTTSIEIVENASNAADIVLNQDQVSEDEDIIKDKNNEIAPYVIKDRNDNVVDDTEKIELQPADSYNIEYAQLINSIEVALIDFEPKRNQIRILNSNEDVVYINYETDKLSFETKDNNSEVLKNYDKVQSYIIEPEVDAVKDYITKHEETSDNVKSYEIHSSIPSLQTKIPTQEKKHDYKEPTPFDDKFAKNYDKVVQEVGTSPVEIDINLLSAKVKDPVNVENIFNEIICDYGEDDIPITVDKTKQSRIPTHKRKSENDVEVSKTLQNTASDNNVSADRVKVKDVINKINDDDGESKPKYRKPKRIDVPSRKHFNSTDSVSQEEAIESSFKQPAKELREGVNFVETFTSPNEEVDSNNILGTIDVTKIEDSDIISNYSKSTIEVFEDKVPTYNETVKLLPAEEYVVEVKTVHEPVKKATVEEIHNLTETLFKESEYIVQYSVKEDYSSGLDDSIVDELNSYNSLRSNTVEVTKALITEDVGLEPKINNDLPADEDIPVNKGKISRIIRGLREPKEDNKVVMSNELPETRSVLSRIAVFERSDPIVASKPRENKIQKLKPTSTYKEAKSYEKTKDTKPNIVSEVIQTTQNEIDPNTDKQSADKVIPNECNNNVTTIEIKTVSIEIVDNASKAAEMVLREDQVKENKDILKDTNIKLASIEIKNRDDIKKIELQPANSYNNEDAQPINHIEVEPIDFEPTKISVPTRKPFNSIDNVSQEEAIETFFEQPAIKLGDDVNFVDTFTSPNEEEADPIKSLGIIDFTKIKDSNLIDNISYSTIEIFEDKVPIYHETVEMSPANECVVEVKMAQEPVKQVSVKESHNVTETLFKGSEYIVQYNVKEESSVVPDSSLVDELKNYNSLQTNTVEVKEALVTEDVCLEPKINNDLSSDEDIPVIKGKVSRIIKRLISREPKDDNKVVMSNELPKTKSVLSRIAMFERPDPIVASKPCDNKIHKFKPNSTYKEVKSYEKTKDTKPFILSEVLKTTQYKIDPNTGRHNADNRMPNEYKNNVTSREIQPISIEIVDIASNAQEFVLNQDQVIENEGISELSNNDISLYLINDTDDNVLNDTAEIELQQADAYETEKAQPINSIEVAPIDFELKRNQIRVLSSNEDVVYINYDTDNQRVETKDSNSKVFKNNENEQSYKTESKIDTVKDYKSRQEQTPDNVQSYKIEPKVKPVKGYKSRQEEIEIPSIDVRLRRLTSIADDANMKKDKSTVESDLGDAVRGIVNAMIVRMNSTENLNVEKKEVIKAMEKPRKNSVSERIALFEGKLSKATGSSVTRVSKPYEPAPSMSEMPDEELRAKVAELESAKLKYGHTQDVKRITLADGVEMPMLAVGTALLDPNLTVHVICAAIDLGYRAIDTAYIYGNEKQVGEAIRKKIEDGTVKREDLFIISKLWSTFHRTDLAEEACRKSLETMGLEYFDLYLIHNPMSFKEGPDPLPKIANVLQYSAHDYIDAWFGVESAVRRGLARSAGVSNFNARQLQRVAEKARVKPTVNQVECHPFLSQQKLDDFCQERGIKLACFGVLGSKGTPTEYKGFNNPVIDDPLVQVMAAGLNITPAQLLIRYQLDQGRAVVVKASSAARLHENLQALNGSLTDAQVDALSALNRNKRTFTFKGMGDTHKNYPFREPF